MTARLGRVMNSIVALNKLTFIHRRHLADGVVMITEVYAKKIGR